MIARWLLGLLTRFFDEAYMSGDRLMRRLLKRAGKP